jgi:hypothetical protein
MTKMTIFALKTAQQKIMIIKNLTVPFNIKYVKEKIIISMQAK